MLIRRDVHGKTKARQERYHQWSTRPDPSITNSDHCFRLNLFCFVKSEDWRTNGRHVRTQWSLLPVTVGRPRGSKRSRGNKLQKHSLLHYSLFIERCLLSSIFCYSPFLYILKNLRAFLGRWFEQTLIANEIQVSCFITPGRKPTTFLLHVQSKMSSLKFLLLSEKYTRVNEFFSLIFFSDLQSDFHRENQRYSHSFQTKNKIQHFWYHR